MTACAVLSVEDGKIAHLMRLQFHIGFSGLARRPAANANEERDEGE
jgi:hypothetical protein